MLHPLLLLAALLTLASPAAAVSVERLVSGLNQPLFVTAPAGDSRLFIVERAGRIRIFENGALRATPFLDISGRVATGGEGGFLGLAFPADYASTRAFYVYYTTSGNPLTSRISRFRASASDPNVADADEKIVLSLAQPYDNHNGGTVAFGPDGMLYMGFGDGGNGNDPLEAGQRGDTLLAKMIRIDVSFSAFTDDYRIPSDNPFVGNSAYRPEIWALGLRNPYRFSFDRQTGALYIADVGQNDREEVDVESASDPGGRNYGWDVMEGTACFEQSSGEPACNSPGLTLPVYEYNHSTGCSITGGYVYRGSQSSISGQYFFADYCTSRIYSFTWNGGGGISGGVVDRTAEFTPPSGQGSITNPVGFGQDGSGELYIVDPGGEIFRVVAANAPACGNGRLDSGEQCDDGNLNSGDGCDANCRTTACGNGIVTSGEQCDDANQTNGDGCDNNCKRTACGNAIVTSGEQCDDGNLSSGDGCDANCKTTACGNGIRTGSEQCDDGNLNSGDGCDANCTVSACGNGIRAGSEQCDDGNLNSGDGCDANCKTTACGNGIRTGSEQCDDGNVSSGDGCDSNCRSTACGNGIVTAGEQCDDGNLIGGDGCDSNCRATGCGNGVLTPPEQCDDGNLNSGDGCDSNCRPTRCGNGVATPGEQCDDGNLTSGDGCDANCTPSACGNGITTGSEACDDGNRTSGDGCDANCNVSGCGNGETSPDEQCDDGNATSGDGCDENCAFTGCGNGVTTDGETCDDGNGDDLDGCSSTCQLEDPAQSRDQTRCILEVNSGVARVARAQTQDQKACLSAAAKGKLGSAPGAFDACLLADLRGRVAEAGDQLERSEGEACSSADPPALALGADRLSGLPAASALPAALVRDVFGAPASALAAREARQASRCQRAVLKGSNGLFEAIWGEIRHAQTDKLEGRRTPPASSDAELSAFLEAELGASRRIKRSQEKLLRRAAKTCQDIDLGELFPGCSPSNFLTFAACSIHMTRCRACELLAETNPRLVVDCDAFDDGGRNASCIPGR